MPAASAASFKRRRTALVGDRRRLPALRVAEEELGQVAAPGLRLRDRILLLAVAADGQVLDLLLAHPTTLAPR